MNYYLNIIKETSHSCERLLETLMDTEKALSFSITIIVFILTISIALIVRLGMISSHGQDTRICTVPFLIVTTICSFGIAGIACWILEARKENRINARTYHSWPYLIFPFLASFIFALMSACSSNGMNIDIYTAIFIGMIATIAEIILISVLPDNKPIYVFLPDSYEQIKEYISLIESDSDFRKRAVKYKDSISCSSGNKEVIMKICDKQYMDKYLLIDEYRDKEVIRTYKKPNGEFFKVLALESNFLPKLADSLAGMLLMILISTPYISICIDAINEML